MIFVHLLLITLLFIIFDVIWFKFSVPRFYEPTFVAIQGEMSKLRVVGGLFAWFLLAFGIKYFVLNNSETAKDAIIKGAILGFVIYGVYNGTNYATLKNYDMKTFTADLCWGTFVTSLVSYIAYKYL